MSRNVDYDKDPIYIVQGDGWDMSFSVAQNGVAYDMTGMQVDINVEDQVGNVIKAISSAGTSPEITGNAAWAAAVTGALCAYNNDWSNVHNII